MQSTRKSKRFTSMPIGSVAGEDDSSTQGHDYFGTYLRSVQSKGIANKVLDSLSNGSMLVSDLAVNVGGSANDVVDAIMRAEKFGYIERAEKDNETTVGLTETGRKLVGIAKRKSS